VAAHLQEAKRVVLDYHEALGAACREGDATTGDIAEALGASVSEDYLWRGMHPFYEQRGAHAVAEVFWQPLVRAMAPLQRRCDVFFAGDNDADDGATTWVCSMGCLMGLFDGPWLDMPPTRRVALLRYAEFSRVADGRIAETAMFCDLLSVMRQAGQFPLPPSTGQPGFYVGPRTGDGLIYDEQDPAEGRPPWPWPGAWRKTSARPTASLASRVRTGCPTRCWPAAGTTTCSGSAPTASAPATRSGATGSSTRSRSVSA